MSGDIFNDYEEENHPPYKEAIMSEAGGDLILADLIERREILFDDVNAKGGMTAMTDDREAYEAELSKIYEAINRRKQELGIEPPLE